MASPRSRGRRACRWLTTAALVTALVSTSLVAVPARALADDSPWIPPVPGRVVAPFQEPVSRYGAGHRGVDFAAAPGAGVRASNDGTVVFAGTVAGALHVVVAHSQGIRTSYSFLSRVDVSVGQHVRRGQVVGASGGTGDGHGPGVLHFGVRIGDRYVDPMLLFRPPDLTEMVRLVPAPELGAVNRPLTHEEAIQLAGREVTGGLGAIDDVTGAAGDVVGAGGELAGDVLGTAGEGVADGIDWTATQTRDYFESGLAFAIKEAGWVGDFLAKNVERLRDTFEALIKVVDERARLAFEVAADIVAALVDMGAWLAEHLYACPQPPARADQPKSDNTVIAVGGRDSSRRRRADGSLSQSFDFEWHKLGYRKRNVAYFSYDKRKKTYTAAETRGDLNLQARRLGAQIRAQAAAHPGQPVDLVGHSQGGVVIALFVQDVYRGHEDEYPPIENIVTFASPLQGTPTANLAVAVDRHPTVRVFQAINPIGFLDLEGQHLGSPALQQLCEGSSTIEGLWHRPPPRNIRWLSISGMEDIAVPSPSTEVPGGGRSIVVQAGDPFVPDDHSAILRDDDAISAAQAHLRGEEPGACGVLAGAWGVAYRHLVRSVTRAVRNEDPTIRPWAIPEVLQ